MPALLSHILVPSLDSLYVQDNRLPNVGADYSRIAGPPRHLWTWQEKMILYILTASYRNPSPDLMKVFNLYFSTRSPGFLMPRQSAWMTMAAFITNPARYRVWWGESTTQQLKDELERLASTTDIELQPAVRNTAQATINRRRRLVSPSTTSTSSSGDQWELDRSDITDDEAHGIPRTPRAPNVNFANGLLTPPPTSSHRARTGPAPIARAIPPIAFRAFSHQSQGINGIDGFVAGSFVGLPAIPGVTNEAEYLWDLERHLGRVHSGYTPFISVSENLLRVIQLVLRRIRESEEIRMPSWYIATINLSRVSSSVRAVWDLNAGIHSRWAFGEWVVYGSISSSNILCVLPMEELLHIMSQARGPYHVDLITTAKRTRAARKAVAPLVKRRLQYNDGVAFGRLLPYLGIPKRYVEHVCTIILKDWGYPEHKAQAWMTNGEFVQGLDDTYRTMSQGFNDIGALDTGEETFSEFLTELEAAAFSPQKLCLPEPGVHPETIVKDESDDDWIVVKDEGADLENLGAVPEHSDGLRDV